MSMTYEEKLTNRMLITEKAESDLDFREKVLERCVEDSVFWCDNFAWTFDPREEEERNIPFILWDKQVRYVRWLESLMNEHKDGLIEKSRDVGVSYTTLVAVVLYQWLFGEFNALIGSRVENKVDKSDDPDALFWKIDYNLRRLPDWMIPEGFEWNKHRTYMRLSRPDNENVITGESSNPNFGRAGRYNLALFDELGFWQNAKSSWESSGSSSPTRLAISTPPESGKASFFYKLRQSEKVDVFTFHYKDDPRRDEEWELQQRAKQSDEEFERERNISYSGSKEGKVYATQFMTVPQGKYPYEPNRPLYASWDFGLDGVAMQWYQWDMDYDKWYKIDSYFNTNKDIRFYVPFVTGTILSDRTYDYDTSDLEKITEHKKWQSATHFGDPDVKKRTLTNKDSAKDILAKYGIHVQYKEWAGRSHYDMRQKAIMFMKKLSVDDTDDFFIESIMQSRYPRRSETSQATTPVSKPIHDIYSHHRSCFEYMADNLPRKEVSVSVPSGGVGNNLVVSDIY